METKVCNKCGLEKPLSLFYLDRRNKNNLKPKNKCIQCEKDYAKKYNKKNKIKIAKRIKEWSVINKVKKRTSSYKWRDNNPEKVRESKNKYNKNRKNTDHLFKLKLNLRTMISNSFRKRNYSKNIKTVDILGCSYEEFKTHLESQFLPWMNWQNRGLYNGTPNYGWDIDHIVPLSTAKTEDDVIRLNHYSNLQPLCSKVNRDIKRSN